MEIVLVHLEDWEAMYLDGIKVAEGHSLAAFQVLEALGLLYTNKQLPRINPDYEEIILTDNVNDIHVQKYGG